ncbi:MBL fold metallo-hydrolase [Rhodoglobus aureus]|uniref:MBL fold metallo-hydrolase n=1 Tax=Rhodoglobus aureus TaxID=191497 RepID=UPI0031CE0257
MSKLTVTYIGGPTALLEYAGLRIVTDPTFDAPTHYPDEGGVPLTKTEGPALSRADVGAVDLVLLSHHEHQDNLDYEGLELLATGVLTISTMKAGSDLFGGGVVGLDSWESREIGAVTVTAVPALHGPPGAEARVGPVTGFVLQAESEPTIYVSGDNASLPLVQQIAGRFPDIDIAVLFAGAARISAVNGPLTLTSADAAEAARILGVHHVVGLHTEGWEHFTETRADLEAAFAGTGLLIDTPRGIPVGIEHSPVAD